MTNPSPLSRSALDPEGSSAARPSTAAQHLQAVTDKDASKNKKSSRLRRAFSSKKKGGSTNPLERKAGQAIEPGESDGQLTYELMNRDSAITLAQEANAADVKAFAYISAAAGAPILPGRYILQPEVMKILETQEKGAGGEIQLTDAMASMIGKQPFHGVTFDGRRFDCGSKAGYIEANLALALEREDLGDHIRSFAKAELGL